MRCTPTLSSKSDVSLDELRDTFCAFVKEARRLQAVYADKISLLVGLETEFITEDDPDRLLQLISEVGGVDYIVGSVHHANGVPIDFDEGTFRRALDSCIPDPGSSADATAADDESKWECLTLDYLEAQYALMTRVRPQVIGHFDLCRLYRPSYSFAERPEVWALVERNVKYAISYGALFEANAAAFRKGWESAYPGQEVVKVGCLCGAQRCLADQASAVDTATRRPVRPLGRLARAARCRTQLRPAAAVSA